MEERERRARRKRAYRLQKYGDNYKVSGVTGGAARLYDFAAPPEYFEELASTAEEKHAMLVHYLSYLYPLSDAAAWRNMTLAQITAYYTDGLHFWYTFNPGWGVSPLPVCLDSSVVAKWSKNTFYQAGTIVQSSITSLCWDYNAANQKEYYAARLNNAPQQDASLTYTTASGASRTVRTVCRDRDYWASVLGSKMEVTSWGWNPYPMGIYSQGPFPGTGTFLDIPARSIVGTSHWDIILQCKAPGVSDEAIWCATMTHELTRLKRGATTVFATKEVNVTPWVVVRSVAGEYTWRQIGWTPLLICYSCFLMGGFGGIGAPWVGVDTPDVFWSSWDKPFEGSGFFEGRRYAVLVEEYADRGETKYRMPLDQSLPVMADAPARTSAVMYTALREMYRYLGAWDTNYIQQRWRYNIFWSQRFGGYVDTSPGVTNDSDDLMQAMLTGNFDIVHHSIWGASLVDPRLSKYSGNPLRYSHVVDAATQRAVRAVGQGGFPTGRATNLASTQCPVFAIRTQMPNVSSDLCSEFADFRVLTPGNLGNGAGDQAFWVDMLRLYAKMYAFTVDPLNPSRFASLSGEREPWFPSAKLLPVRTRGDAWVENDNLLTGKSFFGFDVLSGTWSGGGLAYTGESGEGVKVALPKMPVMLNATRTALDTWPKNAEGVQTAPGMCDEQVLDGLVPRPMATATVNPIQNLGNDSACYDATPPYTCSGPNCCAQTLAPVGYKYYPFATDSFDTGVVGFPGATRYMQGRQDGSQDCSANKALGACLTRWMLGSKAVPWRFDAPLANRIMLRQGLRFEQAPGVAAKKKFMHSTDSLYTFGACTGFFALLYVFVLASGTKNKGVMYTVPVLLLVSLGLLIAVLVMQFPVGGGEKRRVLSGDDKLRLYLSLVYPLVPQARWRGMSSTALKTFFCSLHAWYKDGWAVESGYRNVDAMPSPVQFVRSSFWKAGRPFGPGSKWTDFTTRTHCITGTPEAVNEIDGKKLIGYDALVGTTASETPSGILYRGRQLLTRAGGIAHSSFDQPSTNFHLDNYNAYASVNDTDLEAWKRAQYVEVCSTWCPFPDGAYFDCAQGSGVFLRLGSHIVGYSGLDVVRRAMDEVVARTMVGALQQSYWEEWQRTGFDGMTVDGAGVLSQPSPEQCTVCGLYGSLILTKAQRAQIMAAVGASQYHVMYDESFCADGVFSGVVMSFQPADARYYDAAAKQWVGTMPADQGHVANYPFPLPFGSGAFVANVDGKGLPAGMPQLNMFALLMPVKYQLYNMASMTRSFTLDTMFLNAWAISEEELRAKGGGTFNYVDFLIANRAAPRGAVNSWEGAVDDVMDLISKPVAHPILMKYSRLFGFKSDGPSVVLNDARQWGGGVVGAGAAPSLATIQAGALDKGMYWQDTDTSGGAYFPADLLALPQCDSANLEIDHWMSSLCTALGYDSVCRIQHWCGNKGLTMDVEVVNLKLVVPGNLISTAMTDNTFEIWKSVYGAGWFTLQDPFSAGNVYSAAGAPTVEGQVATWVKPPWIGYDPGSGYYGWSSEQSANYNKSLQLSYLPVNAEEIGLTGLSPQYNSYIWNHVSKLYNAP